MVVHRRRSIRRGPEIDERDGLEPSGAHFVAPADLFGLAVEFSHRRVSFPSTSVGRPRTGAAHALPACRPLLRSHAEQVELCRRRGRLFATHRVAHLDDLSLQQQRYRFRLAPAASRSPRSPFACTVAVSIASLSSRSSGSTSVAPGISSRRLLASVLRCVVSVR